MTPPDDNARIDMSVRGLRERLLPQLRERIPADKAASMPRAEIAQIARDVCTQFMAQRDLALNALDQRDLITALINGFLATAGGGAAAATVNRMDSAAPQATDSRAASAKFRVDGPIRIGVPQAAASIRFWLPKSSRLPPMKATSAAA